MHILKLFCWCFAGSIVQGTPHFANLFQGGAVLQRDTQVVVWGSDAGGGSVTLHIDGEYVMDAAVDADGNWSVTLPPHPASFGNELTVLGQDGNSTTHVSFGDVLLCSGQSNMDMPVVNKPGGFQADNGTAEAAAADRYSGGIWLWKQVQSKYHNPTAWTSASNAALTAGFSAVCWYTGKNHYERLGGQVPVGLLQASVGGSPIEYWLSSASIAKCIVDQPQCDAQWPDSIFHDDQIVSLQPYTVGAIVWDQGERDLKCNHVEQYACMQRELARSWRKEFRCAGVPFVVVQLPDYYDAADPGAVGHPGYASAAEGLFKMRLAQEAGLVGDELSAIVASYDQSCNNLEFPEDCPFGSVHNIHKQEVAKRIAAQLARLMHAETVVTEGPRAQEVVSTPVGNRTAGHSVTVRFAGGTKPFSLQPTRNCSSCCDGTFGTAALGDFDVSHDGSTWMPGNFVRMQGDDGVVFHVELPHTEPPNFVRYTAGSNFTQCALYNQEVLPAWPFQMEVTSTLDSIIV